MVGLALQIVLFGPLLRTCQRVVDAGFFRFMLGENRVKDVTEVLTSTVSPFFMHHRDRLLIQAVLVSTWPGFRFVRSG